MSQEQVKDKVVEETQQQEGGIEPEKTEQQISNGNTKEPEQQVEESKEETVEKSKEIGEITYTLEMDLPNEEASSIVKQTLEVDEELYADVIKREITIKGKSFKLQYKSSNVKKLRSAVGNITENIALILKTIDEFK